MHIPISLPAAATALLLSTLPSAAAALEPWNVLSLGTYSPSGRPGSSIWSTLNFTIAASADASAGPSGDIRCNQQWSWRLDEDADPLAQPYDRVTPCNGGGVDDAGALWAFTVRKSTACVEQSPSATTCFDLEVTRGAPPPPGGASGPKKYRARGHFSTETNMRGMCAGSGFCNWALATEAKPFYVQPEEVV